MSSQPVSKLTPEQLVQRDGRMLVMLDWTQKCLVGQDGPISNNNVLMKVFAKHHELLEELLADRRKFKYLFIWTEEPTVQGKPKKERKHVVEGKGGRGRGGTGGGGGEQ